MLCEAELYAKKIMRHLKNEEKNPTYKQYDNNIINFKKEDESTKKASRHINS